MTAVVFDVGGTNTRLAITRDARRFGKPLIFPTGKRFETGISRLAVEARRQAGSQRITVVAGGVPGPLNSAKTTLLACRHLPSWAGKDVAGRLRKLLSARVILDNDSALAALGEATVGAGKDYRIVAYINVGTGIGGARIVDQRIDVVAAGFEPGHHLVDFSHPGLEWEQVMSGSAIWAREHCAPSSIHSRTFWQRAALPIALGLVNVTLFWSPDAIVLGGSMFKRWGISLSDVRRKLARYLPLLPKPPRLVKGALGEFGGLFGGLVLIRQLKG